MRSRTSCRRVPPTACRHSPDLGCLRPMPDRTRRECDGRAPRFTTTITTSERENPMPDGIAVGHFDPYTFNLAAATPGEVYDFWTLTLASGTGDVLGALRQVFARVRREVREAWFEREFPDIVAEFGSIGDEDLELDAEPEPEPGLEEDDYGLGCGWTSFEYRCTVQELEEGGYGGGFSEVDLGATPEHDPEFIEADDEEPSRARDLLDSAERWDGPALPGLTRAAGALVDQMCDRCPLEAA
jgi:hypothetical protein